MQLINLINNTKLIFIIITLLFISSCNSNQPSVSTAKKLLKTKISSESEGKIKLNAFKKLDAYEEKNFMGEFYAIKCKFEIKFLQNCYYCQEFMSGKFNDFRVRNNQCDSWGYGSVSSLYFEGGTILELSKIMYLRKTEKGWDIVELNTLR